MARQLLELNLIETAWAWIKGELKDSRTNMEEFEEDLKLWILRMEDSQYHKDLVVSMPKRLQEVVQRNRGSTHFQLETISITFAHFIIFSTCFVLPGVLYSQDRSGSISLIV